jgi:hypothetical protein
VALVSEMLYSSMRPGMAGVYIADPIYTLNARKLIENVTKARLAKDQLLRGATRKLRKISEKKRVYTPGIFRIIIAIPSNQVRIKS